MLRIKYPQFLNCCDFLSVDQVNCTEIIEKIESLAYGERDSKSLSVILERGEYTSFIELLIKKYNLLGEIEKEDDEKCKKKKAIKDIMVENYLVKLKHEKKLTTTEIKSILLKINMKLFLKMLPLKNIIVENGEISSINDPLLYL